MKLGVCYYPEHWTPSDWAQDAARMRKANISVVRIGEFAWSRIEPSPDTFTWDWLDSAIDTLGQAGLNIVLGTPTATPPRWMVDKYPDMLAHGRDGQTRGFGSRRHYCFSHLPYRDQAARIARVLAARYGKNPHITAWQIDNEYGCHNTTQSYSPAAKNGFCDWLAQKYQSIDALNRAWGNVFWSMDYDDFTQIDLPNICVTEPNPAHAWDFRRYSSAQVVAFNRAQSDAIRAHSTAPLIHNYMGRTTDFDHYEVGADLDIASWDSYPLGFLEEALEDNDDWKARFYTQGDPDFQAFHHDLYRAVGRGRWWVMEQQPGPVNWAAWNPIPKAGMVRLWTWEAFAHGAEVVSFFRWRQAGFAQEQMHAGLLRSDGSDAAGLAEVTQVGQELAELGETGVTLPKTPRADIALVFDYPSQWAWDMQPQGRDFDYFRVVFDTYRALRRLGLSVDIIPAQADEIKGRRLIIIPALMQAEADFTQALNASDAVIVYGPRFASKAEAMMTNTNAPDINGLDVQVLRVATLRPNVQIALANGGFVKKWMEDLATKATVIEATVDDSAVVVGQDGGQDKRFYIGAWLDDTALIRVLTDMAKHAGITTEPMPEGLRKRHTAWGDMLVNYNDYDVDFNGMCVKACDVLNIKP
ncbi:MAG: beta-galactosidase [Candidatus Halichondribacter symbioticus]